MKPRFRNAHISLAIGVAMLIVGEFLFRNSGEGALQIFALVTLIVMFGTLTLLNERDERRQKHRQ